MKNKIYEFWNIILFYLFRCESISHLFFTHSPVVPKEKKLVEWDNPNESRQDKRETLIGWLKWSSQEKVEKKKNIEREARTFSTKTRALFRCEIFLDFATVALSFIYGKYYLIID